MLAINIAWLLVALSLIAFQNLPDSIVCFKNDPQLNTVIQTIFIVTGFNLILEVICSAMPRRREAPVETVPPAYSSIAIVENPEIKETPMKDEVILTE